MKVSRIVLKFKASTIFFVLSFTFYTVSLFVKDLYNADSLEMFSEISRGLSYFFIVIGLVNAKLRKRTLVLLLPITLFFLIVLFRSDVLYFLILLLLAILALKIDDTYILKLSSKLLIILTAITLILCAIGVIPDIQTARWGSNAVSRHSFGFYHSNVLPLLFMYICSYYFIYCSKRIKNINLLGLEMLNFILYRLCNSRNAFTITTLLIFSYFLDRNIKSLAAKKRIYKVLYFLAIITLPLLCLISITAPFFVSSSSLIRQLDFSLSYRFTYIILKISSTGGLKLLSTLNTSDYFKDGIIVDNGYAFVAIRYGLIMIFLLCMLTILLANKSKKNMMALSVIVLISLANFIDNDIFDYSCLPFLLIGIKSIGIIVNERKYSKKSAEFKSTVNISINEHI